MGNSIIRRGKDFLLQTNSPTTGEGKLNELVEAGKRKRVHDVDTDELVSTGVSPRKRLKSTAQYIHQKLFLEGENSDVTITALGHEWNLHKVYLCQAYYFQSMFSGCWLESHKSSIDIEIVDSTVTKEALDITFSSFYSDDIDPDVLAKNLVPVTGAAYMFQLDGLMEHCRSRMLELLTADTVCSYHAAACRYGITEVETRCFEWLKRNLLLTRTPVVAKEISFELLQSVIGSSDFVVMQVEIDLYNFIKIWVYLRLHPESSVPLQNLVERTQEYFVNRCKDEQKPLAFLHTELGFQFAPLFRLLRFDHLLEDQKGISLIEKDSIIPQDWLLPVYKEQWKKLLCVHDASDPGPLNISVLQFEKHACRCGRILERDIRYCWRWTGFSFGIDIILFYNPSSRRLVLKRNTFCQACNSTVCMQNRRAVAVKFKLFTVDKAGHELNQIKSGLTIYNLSTDEEVLLFTLDDTWTFPIYVSARILIASPLDNDKSS